MTPQRHMAAFEKGLLARLLTRCDGSVDHLRRLADYLDIDFALLMLKLQHYDLATLTPTTIQIGDATPLEWGPLKVVTGPISVGYGVWPKSDVKWFDAKDVNVGPNGMASLKEPKGGGE